jgi:teichuronic acid biosynthesis glycosyltransferase TuaC
MRVAVVAAEDRSWAAQRQARATGVDVRVIVLRRPWAAFALAAALRVLRRRFPFDLVHAHGAAPTGDAVRRARLGVPLVVSVDGGEVLTGTPVRRTLAAARVTLADSREVAARARALGAGAVRVVHPGADVPATPAHDAATLVTAGDLVARRRHADVLRALWLLRERHPDVRWVVVGDGPERPALTRLATDLELSDRVRLRGDLPAAEALAAVRGGGVFVLPSVDEASPIAYLEAMAAGLPAIGCRGEPGPEEIAASGDGMRLVAPGDPEALARELDALLAEPAWRRELGAAARATVANSFSWEGCGRATLAAYEDALR